MPSGLKNFSQSDVGEAHNASEANGGTEAAQDSPGGYNRAGRVLENSEARVMLEGRVRTSKESP